MLPMENMDWTTIVGWADPQTLLIGDGHGGGHGGYLIAWDWRDQRLRVVTRFPPGQGLRYEIATDLLR